MTIEERAALRVGDRVKGTNPKVLHCGSGCYDYAIVVNVSPLVLVSVLGDMLWSASTEQLVPNLEAAGKADWCELYSAIGRYAIESKWREQVAAACKLQKDVALLRQAIGCMAPVICRCYREVATSEVDRKAANDTLERLEAAMAATEPSVPVQLESAVAR